MSSKPEIATDFQKVYEDAHAPFWRFCRARCYGRLEPEDLMQESLLIAYKQFADLKKKEKFLSFLIGIAVRVLANDNRKFKEHEWKDNEKKEYAEQPGLSDIDFLYECIAKLPAAQGEAVILFEISGYKLKEIADIQGAKLNTVKQRLKRGREALQKALQENLVTDSSQHIQR